jgi:hypothetical protein
MPSSVIRSFRYDEGSRELYVIFQSGRRYTYEGVPPELYRQMRVAFSKGEFFNKHIRGQYRFVRSPRDASGAR